MKVKKLARIHLLSVLLVGMFSGYDAPICTAYVGYSILLWGFGYPLYFLLGEPGWE